MRSEHLNIIFGTAGICNKNYMERRCVNKKEKERERETETNMGEPEWDQQMLYMICN